MKRENAVTLICIRIPHMLIQVFFLIEMVQQFYCTVKFVQNKSLVLTFKKSTFYAKKWMINPSFGREFLLLARSKMPDSVIFWTFFPKFVFHFSIFYTGGYWGIGHGLMSSQVWACIVIEQELCKAKQWPPLNSRELLPTVQYTEHEKIMHRRKLREPLYAREERVLRRGSI